VTSEEEESFEDVHKYILFYSITFLIQNLTKFKMKSKKMRNTVLFFHIKEIF